MFEAVFRAHSMHPAWGVVYPAVRDRLELHVRWSGSEDWTFVGDTDRLLTAQRKLQYLFYLLMIDEDPPVPARV